MPKKRTIVMCVLVLILVALGLLIILTPAAPNLISDISLTFIGYTNSAAGSPVALIEMRNTSYADVLPLIAVADLTSGKTQFVSSVPNEALPAGAHKAIEMAYSPKFSRHKFYVAYSKSPYKYRIFQWAQHLHATKIVPSMWSATQTTFLDVEGPSK